MYITVDRNNRGNLEISKNVLDKLVEAAVITGAKVKAKTIEIVSDISHDNILYLIVKLTLNSPKDRIDFNEKKIIKSIEDIILQTLNFKPKNVAIAYLK